MLIHFPIAPGISCSHLEHVSGLVHSMLRYYYSQVADWVALENDGDNVGSRLANNHSEHEKHHSAESGVGCETKVKCKRG
jgi:hypothetical protein